MHPAAPTPGPRLSPQGRDRQATASAVGEQRERPPTWSSQSRSARFKNDKLALRPGELRRTGSHPPFEGLSSAPWAWEALRLAQVKRAQATSPVNEACSNHSRGIGPCARKELELHAAAGAS